MSEAGEDDVLDLSVGTFLDRLADRTPTPGGGSVAALAGSLACAMARMVAAYSLRRQPQAAPLAEKLERADHLLRRLVAEDIAAYEALSAAARQAKTDPQTQNRKQEALVTATLVPLEMAATAVSALAAMDELKTLAGKSLISDLGVAAALGLACARAAECSVRVNLGEMDDASPARELAQQITDLTARAADLARAVAGFVDQTLQNRAG